VTAQAVRPSDGSATPGDPATSAAASQAKAKARSSDSTVRSIGVTLTLLALVILGFVGYLYVLSGVQEARSQTILYARMQGELGQGTAPTGPAIPGHPVTPASLAAVPGDPIALLDIPSIHLRDVVIVERATFGAQFADVPQLRKGDLITTITSQGLAHYTVIAVSNSSKPVPFRELPNQLLLVTADSQIAPAHYIEVEAKLLTSPQPESGYLPSVSSAEVALGRDPYALIPAMAQAIALAAAALCGSLLAARWSRWGAWLVTIPVIIAIVWNLYESLSALLPNLY